MKKSKVYGQLSLLAALEADLPKELAETSVKINKVINLKSSPIGYYDVSMNYGDLTLIIAILRDYVAGFDKMLEEGERIPIGEVNYTCYYRDKFLRIAGRLSEQIEYDYDEKRKKCLKKAEKEDNSDVGGEALSLALKRSYAKKEEKKEEGGKTA